MNDQGLWDEQERIAGRNLGRSPSMIVSCLEPTTLQATTISIDAHKPRTSHACCGSDTKVVM